jgi:hypothetical protein
MSNIAWSILLKRYRMLVTADGMIKDLASETDAQLLDRLKGSLEDRARTMEELTSLVPESYWQRRGLT